jgi:DDE family transposase
VLSRVPHDEQFAIIDSLPVPVCQFARAHRCRRFRAEAAFGKDTLVRQTVYGLRVHVRLEWPASPGLITRFGIAAANVHELSALPPLTEATRGSLVGDRNYWSPAVAAEWQQHGVELLAPYRTAKRDPHPRWSARLSRVRYRIVTICTVFGQLVDRCSIKRLWARDLWHLSSRLLRKVLMHTLAVLFNADLGNSPLQLARVVAS